jgi:hypothetical chaperone protein
MILGMDFGTTNTGAALFDGETIRILPLDPDSQTPHVCRSAIYMTRSGEFYLGSTALNNYFSQNVGRATRYHKVWVGEIAQVFAELPAFFRDVYFYEDEYSPGRLFTSIKSVLRNREYYGTVHQGDWFTASDLVAVFFIGMKMRIDQHYDNVTKSVVLGRPVHFSTDPLEDQIAQSRLLDAAFKAGYERVYLEYEPVAAALSYERTLREKETVLVFDFGGGTLDFTVMQIGVPGQRQVLATGGIPIAGDVFDQRLFRGTVPKHLGEGDYFVSAGRRYPIPAHIYDSLTNPHEILALNTPENLEMLRGIHAGALHPEKTLALLQVVSSNYALLMFDLIERVKCRLSSEVKTGLTLKAEKISIEEDITRARFERLLTSEYEAIRKELVETIKRSSLPVEKIDRVIRTGGSSQIPLFVKLLNGMFGAEKVRAIDAFSSVTAGLAIRGYQISTGQEDLPVYTPDDSGRSTEQASSASQKREAHQVDLGLVKRRLQVRHELSTGQTSLPEWVWLILQDGAINIFAAEDPAGLRRIGKSGDSISSLARHSLGLDSQVSLARMGDHALFVTDRFKFITVEIKDLFLAQLSSRSNINHVLPLEDGETVMAFTPWKPEAPQLPLVAMVTKLGQARTFEARLLAEQISRRPYFLLERRYLGFPITLFSTLPGAVVLAGTDNGRLAFTTGEEISVNALEMIKVRKTETVVAAGSVPDGELICVLNKEGNYLPVDPDDLPNPDTTPGRAYLLRRNFVPRDFLPTADLESGQVYGLTTQARLLRVNPPDGNSKKLIRMQADEHLIACLDLTG